MSRDALILSQECLRRGKFNLYIAQVVLHVLAAGGSSLEGEKERISQRTEVRHT